MSGGQKKAISGFTGMQNIVLEECGIFSNLTVYGGFQQLCLHHLTFVGMCECPRAGKPETRD